MAASGLVIDACVRRTLPVTFARSRELLAGLAIQLAQVHMAVQAALAFQPDLEAQALAPLDRAFGPEREARALAQAQLDRAFGPDLVPTAVQAALAFQPDLEAQALAQLDRAIGPDLVPTAVQAVQVVQVLQADRAVCVRVALANRTEKADANAMTDTPVRNAICASMRARMAAS